MGESGVLLELSLHILDVIENSTRAGASVVYVAVTERREEDLLEIDIEDDGPGLPVAVEDALDPFFTTKSGERTGLGLSLFRAAAEQAGGNMTVGESVLGGVAVKAWMRLSHIDRAPLGDLAGTLSGVLLTNPDVDLWCRVSGSAGETLVQRSELAKEFAPQGTSSFALAREYAARVNAALQSLDA